MTTTTKALSVAEQRSRLERRANVIRARLVRAIDALDLRRHQVQKIGHDAKRLALPVAGSLFGIVVLAAGTTFALRAVMERRRERYFGYRFAKAIAPFRAPARPTFWGEAFRRVALTVIGIVAAEVATRGARRYFEARKSPIALLGPGASPGTGPVVGS